MILDGFVAERPRLLSVAHRILGSAHDAEDAVQTAWLRVQTTDADAIDNVPAWLTTVVTRVCLDLLRDRQRRDALTRRADTVPATDLAADEEFLVREDVSRALMVLLNRLTPPQRVAFVLHDLFGIPFDQVADVLGTTSTGAKKHASRARARIRPGSPPVTAAGHADTDTRHHAIVTAFLRAAGGGDVARMIELMAPDCVRIAEGSLIPPGTPTTVSGAGAVAEETRLFVDRIRASTPMRVNGRVVHVIAPGGHPLATIAVDTRDGVITCITIAPINATDELEAVANQPSVKCDL